MGECALLNVSLIAFVNALNRLQGRILKQIFMWWAVVSG